MSTAEIIYSTLGVMIITWFPVWAYDREMGVWKFTKIAFWSLFCLSEVFFLIFAVNVGFWKGIVASFIVSIISLFFAWFVYFGQNMFKDRR